MNETKFESEACDREPELPGLTSARARELCAELSLLDICRLAVTKAVQPDGLSLQSAAAMEITTADVKLVIRRLRRRKG